MRISLVWGLAVVSALALSACGSSSDAAGLSCDAMTNQGQPIVSSSSAAAVPAMTGGTLVEGTYVLTGNVYYAGDPGSGTVAQTMIFSGGGVKSIVDDGGSGEAIYAGTYETSGSTLTLSLTCPQAATLSPHFTANATGFTMTSPDNPNHVLTFTKQ